MTLNSLHCVTSTLRKATGSMPTLCLQAGFPLVFVPGTAQVLVLAPRCLHQMRHGIDATFGCREKRRQSRNVPDVTAWQANGARKRSKTHVTADGSLFRKGHLPNSSALSFLREWKLNDSLHASHKSFVNMVLNVGGKDGNALVFLHFLEQVADLDVGVTVVRILHFRPLPE